MCIRFRVIGLSIFILLLYGKLSAQQQTLDSLKRILNSTRSDTVKVMTLIRLSEKMLLKGNATEKTLDFSSQALNLATKIDFRIGMAYANLQIAQYYLSNYKYTEAPAYLQACEIIAIEEKNKPLLAKIHKNFWSIEHHMGKYEIAEKHAEQYIDISKELKNDAALADAYVCLALSNQVQGAYSFSLELYHKALGIQSKDENNKEIGTTINNIGDIYENMHRYEDAILYYQKGYNFFEQKTTGNQRATGMAVCLIGLASCYKQKGKNDFALQKCKEALSLTEKINHKILLNFALNLCSQIYILQKEYDLAFDYAKRGVEVNTQSGFKEGKVNCLLSLGRIEIERSNPDSAKSYLMKAYQIALNSKLLKQLSLNTLLLSKCDSIYGNFESALKFYQQHKIYSDSLVSADESLKMGGLEASYRYELKINEQKQKEIINVERQEKLMIIYALFGLGILAFAGVIFYRYRIKIKTNRLLKQKNQRIENQKNELNTALEQLQNQNKKLEIQKELIEDSIHYAYQIQTAILPDTIYLQKILPPNFIFYQPKDIVSGDFYWAAQHQNLLFLCVVDCTGHGVPGALMSVIGANALLNIIRTITDTSNFSGPNFILQEMDRMIKITLKQDEHSESKDGMDLAVCVFSENKCEFAGAGRPLYHVRDGILTEIKGDRFPVGGGQHEIKIFTNHVINLLHGDRFYLFTDGITDQFGGENGKKLTPKGLKDFILTHQPFHLETQGEKFQTFIADWMKDHNQMDDLTLIGIEF